ncbi:MAG: beta-galactosidase trimerization domain-containing protein [Cytophagales bacterium]|nr:beta-galactosidase trimerization domain-containing protein [Armatimonadota bacterium]
MPLPYRQVHLDFHTSEKIPRVGAAFDRTAFQELLTLGHVNSVTLFSKCHHGLTYHDTHVGVRHPALTCDLLPLQIEACHEIGIQTPIYLSAGLDEAAISIHPEWGIRSKGGGTFDPLRAGYKMLCFGGPYLDYLCAQIEEAVTLFQGRTPGIFLDIVAARRCWCRWCLLGMEESGLDPASDTDADLYAQVVLQRYYARTTDACRIREPEMRVFHNGGHIPKGALETFLKWNSHLELESLPTGGWGYDHFPASAKYAATTGLDFLGMTGKFHTTWGEFGGFKRAAALRYECAAMIAFGAKCSVGDQLHPSAALNRDTYALIGAAYAEVAAKEAWCEGARGVADIAVVSPEALQGGVGGHRAASLAETGVTRLLLELHLLFDVVDLDADLSGYKVVVLPDEFRLSGAFRDKVAAYLAGGGRLLLSGDSGLAAETDTFALDLGLTVEGRSPFDPDYLISTDQAPTAPVRGPFVIYGGAWNVRADQGCWRALAHRAEPYFNRGRDHFSSHQHTPDVPGAGEYPGALIRDSVAWFAHAIFTAYRQCGQPLYRDLVADALAHLLPHPTVTISDFPTAARLTLNRQPEKNRQVLHLLYAVPALRGAAKTEQGTGAWAVEVIEDLTPLYDIRCAVQTADKIHSVTLEPQGQKISFTQESGEVRFTVPRLLCHQMIALTTG